MLVSIKDFFVKKYLSIFGLCLIFLGANLILNKYTFYSHSTDDELLRLVLKSGFKGISGSLVLLSGVLCFIADRRFRRKNN